MTVRLDLAHRLDAGSPVSPHRITLTMAGRGMPSRWVVSQKPAAGAPLGPGDAIELQVAGLGYFHNLPVAFWHAGGEAEMSGARGSGVIWKQR